jgi:hypothetical protein
MKATRGRAIGPALAAVSIVLTAAGCSSLSTRPPYDVQLSGTWLLNESLSNGLSMQSQSEDGRSGDKGRGMRRSGGMDGGGGRGGGGGGGRMHGGGMRGDSGAGSGSGGPDSKTEAQQGRGKMAVFQRPRKLSIEQSASQLKLVADGTSTEFVYGAKDATSFGNDKAERTAGWKGDDFVVKLQVEGGPKITWTYEAVDDGSRLIVETVTSRGRGRLEQKAYAMYEQQENSIPVRNTSGK